MRIYNKQKGEKIIEVIAKNEPYGITFRGLCRKTGFAKNTINKWLIRLREFDIIRSSPKYPIKLTQKYLYNFKQGILDIPDDKRKKKKKLHKTNKKYSKDHIFQQKIRFLILTKSTFGSAIYYRYSNSGLKLKNYDPSDSTSGYFFSDFSLPGIGLDDIVDRFPNHEINSANLEASFPENRINFDNGDLFGYLKISKKYFNDNLILFLENDHSILKKIEREPEKDKLFKKALDYELKSNHVIHKLIKKRYMDIRYEISDELLKEFVMECIFILQPVNYLFKLLFTYEINDYKYKLSEKFDKTLKDLHHDYVKWFGELYGHNILKLQVFKKIRSDKSFFKKAQKFLKNEKNKKSMDSHDRRLKQSKKQNKTFHNFLECKICQYKSIYSYVINSEDKKSSVETRIKDELKVIVTRLNKLLIDFDSRKLNPRYNLLVKNYKSIINFDWILNTIILPDFLYKILSISAKQNKIQFN